MRFLPFTDLTSSKRRPALVVSPDSFNDHLQDVVLVALTSKLTAGEQIEVDARDCVDEILPKKSAIASTKMSTIPSSLIVKKICALKPEKLDQVLAEIRTFFS
jgi:mRNA interferase MazF